ncbi:MULTISPECIES: phage baseplate assembly protein V [Snodgrassella]|uniref:phage baseplate assembly protein V n=1 Tax=Snodgrassella TaxID=1193515 RepID=UPI000815E988|nr:MULTISPECIES: phage baseplate assembly protein V [Snodgrassella]SCB71901.1 phage baseplate assembly protein V [Snodgrassella sp. R-53583]
MQKLYEFGATLQFGLVEAIDAGRHMLKVNIPALENMHTDWLPMLTAAAGGNCFYSLPDVGELVACILDARGESGVVLGALYNQSDTAPAQSNDMWVKQFSNGTVISHDRKSGEVCVQTSGTVVVEADTVLVKASDITLDAPSTTATGSLLVQGKLTYQGGMAGSGGGSAAASIAGTIKVKGGDVVADGKSLKSHTHPDLTSGGHTGTPD